MADVSVRGARAADVPEIVRIQLVTWQSAYASILPEETLETLRTERAQAQWHAAIAAPPSARHHVLVAEEQHWVVGFTALGPVENDLADHTDTTAEIATLLVEPRWTRRGHGSRLLAASVDHMREDGFTTAITWIPDQDRGLQTFYESAGWQPDGSARVLDAGGTRLREIKLHASIVDSTEEKR